MVSDVGGAAVTLVHVHPVPVSTVQVALQPSPGVVFPSSQPSCGNFSPSPHTAVHVPPLHLGSIAQVGEQPSYGIRFPSSHCSEPSLMPSPHWVTWQTDFGGVPVETHANAGSTLHVALQPSPEVVFPSSQWSLPSPFPFPQSPSRVHGAFAVGQV